MRRGEEVCVCACVRGWGDGWMGGWVGGLVGACVVCLCVCACGYGVDGVYRVCSLGCRGQAVCFCRGYI